MHISFNHLDQNSQDYFSHFKNASSIAFKLFLGSLKTFVHSVYPDAFEKCATDTVKEVSKDLNVNNDSIELLNVDNFVGDENIINDENLNNESNINDENIINDENKQ